MLHLPPAVSVSRFQGGYKSIASYTELSDTETNNAVNVVYGPDGGLTQRDGCLRYYNSPLFSTSATGTGRPITGHYYFEKLGDSASFNIVAAGDGLFNVTSSTANPIRTTLTDNSETYWNFVQIQDPRSAADDIAVMTNGVDPIQVWTGSATCVALSSFTSATQVPVCKYLLNHKERLYAINIIDNTDADAAVRVRRTGFGSDGLADPHRFTESFYVGGSDRAGEIQAAGVLNDQIMFYRENAIWKFLPSLGDNNALLAVDENIGVLAPHSFVNVGDFHIFLSHRGVFAFDGSRPIHLSEYNDDQLFLNANQSQLKYAKATFDHNKNQYILYIPQSGSDRNDTGFIYDLRPSMKCWQPPVTGRRVNYISNFKRSNQRAVIYGDYNGFLYEEGPYYNDGILSGYNGLATSAAAMTLTDSAAAFTTTGPGLAGYLVRVIEGTGENQERVIESNTSNVLTINAAWGVVPDTTSRYTIAAVDAIWKSKDYDFGGHDINKIFRHVRVRTREEGNINLTMQYIVNFKTLSRATTALIALIGSGFVWGVGVWDRVVWGGGGEIKTKVSLRSTSEQSTQGTHLALRFYNRRANERFKIFGYDIELKALGKR